MPKPPASSATPRPMELLARLTTLSQELAGAFRPATVVEVVARTLDDLLKPDRLSFVLLDAQTNQLAVTHDTSAVPARRSASCSNGPSVRAGPTPAASPRAQTTRC